MAVRTSKLQAPLMDEQELSHRDRQKSGSDKSLTKKQLEARLDEAKRDIEALTVARSEAAAELEVARGTIHEQLEAITIARGQVAAAQEAVLTARAQAAAAEEASAALQVQLEQAVAAAVVPPAANGLGEGAAAAVLPMIERPAGSGWSIREAMDIGHADYAEIQRTIRSLVIRAQLDWTDDFRRQDADKLATMFRAARKAHPVLRRYVNNWATAAIARQYMQNKRKHAYKQGYIKKKPNGMDEDNQRRHGDDDGAAGAGGVSA